MSDFSKSFTYMICSDDRMNNLTALPAAGTPVTYDIMFGGFSEPYDDYFCEVLSFSAVGGFPAGNTYYLFCASDLNEDGYFFKNKFSQKDCVLSILPLSAFQDAMIQSDGGSVKFRVNNCRMQKLIQFTFLKTNLATAVSIDDINVGPIETKWVLTLRMTPIEKR